MMSAPFPVSVCAGLHDQRLCLAGPALTTACQSVGCSRTIDAPWLLPTQNDTVVVVSSTNDRRMLVGRGSRYSVNVPDAGSSRSTRSAIIPPPHTSPFRSATTSYGKYHGAGGVHSRKVSV